MKIIFMTECAVDGCYEKNTLKKDGKQMCIEHQKQYDEGVKLKAFYGKTVQKQIVSKNNYVKQYDK
jgi:hypothetical protein